MPGARYCRRLRRRSPSSGTPFRVHHAPGGPVLTVHRRRVFPPRARTGPVAVTAAAITALAASVTALLVGPAFAPAPAATGCPPRHSETVAASGHTLRLRLEPPRGANALLHLCLDEPVRSWSLSTGAAVQAVAPGEALAALTLPPATPTPVTVTIETTAAERLHFETLLRS
jgi:hypothetical protein